MFNNRPEPMDLDSGPISSDPDMDALTNQLNKATQVTTFPQKMDSDLQYGSFFGNPHLSDYSSKQFQTATFPTRSHNKKS